VAVGGDAPSASTILALIEVTMSYDRRTLTSPELSQKLDENKIKGIRSMAKTLSAELLNYREPLKPAEIESIIITYS
jgi:hypothetical protein